jgi:hypothetical protein
MQEKMFKLMIKLRQEKKYISVQISSRLFRLLSKPML